VSFEKWLIGARIKTLPAAVSPVLIGTALAGVDRNWLRALLALVVSLSLQIAVNFANDYSDGIRGADEERVGPTRLVASGLATADSVKRAAQICFLVAAIAGGILAIQTSYWLILVGLIAIAAAWFYTGGTNPYGYLGFGEISVFIFFGLVATMGTFYVQSEKITLLSFIAALPMGALSCAILMVNNLRDREADELVGKRTLAVRIGDRASRRTFIALMLFAHFAALATLTPLAVFTLLVAPLSFDVVRNVGSVTERGDFIPLLGKVGRLQLLFALFLSAALWLSL
jgi:1,4-dihydroxy-2-naphthoate octaprenyltransferase